jgi:hypothetical protein
VWGGAAGTCVPAAIGNRRSRGRVHATGGQVRTASFWLVNLDMGANRK